MDTIDKTIIAQLIEAGHTLHKLGMVPATSGNFSARLDDEHIVITVSGVHKGHLTQNDFMIMGLDGKHGEARTPSAEAGLHLQLYQAFPGINAILHPHSRAATQTRNIHEDSLHLQGYELLKAFKGIDTHETSLVIPVFENDQDIPRLAACVESYLQDHDDLKAYIIRGHGFYTWADSIARTVQYCEALEFLLQCELDKHRFIS